MAGRAYGSLLGPGPRVFLAFHPDRLSGTYLHLITVVETLPRAAGAGRARRVQEAVAPELPDALDDRAAPA